MKITITTTEKKLTLSYLKQMPGLPYELFDNCEVLGYITANIWKPTNMLALCHCEGEYYLHNMLWKLSEGGDYQDPYLYHSNVRGRGTYTLRVDTKIIEDWFKKHQRICKVAREIHIYV